MLVASLLIGVIIAGFGQAFLYEGASGAATSYSTVTVYSTRTTTSYYHYYTTTTSERFRTTTEITDRLEQLGFDGPYVKITGRWSLSSGVLTLDGTITNLMSLGIQGGGIRFKMVGLGRWGLIVGMTDIDIAFGAISPKGSYTYTYQTSIPAGYSGIDEVLVSWVGINLYRTETIVKTIFLERYTYTRTVAEAYTRTYTETYVTTTEYAISEPTIGTMGILFPLLVVGAVVVVLALFFLRRKAPTPSPVPEHPKEVPTISAPTPPPPVTPTVVEKTKHCPECGLNMPLEAKHCPKCGAKQDYFGED